MNRTLIAAAVIALAALASTGIAREGRGGGGGTRTSVGNASHGGNANVNRNNTANVNRNTNVNQNTNINRNTNVNVNRDVNVHVDNGWDNHHDNWDHPVAAAAAIGTAAAVTAAAIGSIAYSIPPSCVPVNVNGVTFQQCGSTWYQPQYAGSSVQYVVVTAPR
ncbi:MAG TPA: hypothetical protein VFV97_09370 [Rhodanobacteraceae bacterium]|nr:hypothetical protein [Rhodanobacteraceae bacterium]